MPETFVRVQATYRGRLGVEVGVLVAVDHLRRAGVLTATEQAVYLDVDDWFLEHLPNPDFYADGNTIGAVTWFREPVPAPMRERVEQLCAILRAHRVPFDVVRSSDPGTLVYSDALQVGVVPHTRGEPTPLPDGLVQTPTSPGSKRAVAGSPVRHVVLDVDDVAQTPAAVVEALRRNGYGVHPVAAGTLGAVGAGTSAADTVGAGPSAAGTAGERLTVGRRLVDAARRLGPDLATVLVVSGAPADAEAARTDGVAAVVWSVAAGDAALVELLAEHGVDGRPTATGTTTALDAAHPGHLVAPPREASDGHGPSAGRDA